MGVKPWNLGTYTPNPKPLRVQGSKVLRVDFEGSWGLGLAYRPGFRVEATSRSQAWPVPLVSSLGSPQETEGGRVGGPSMFLRLSVSPSLCLSVFLSFCLALFMSRSHTLSLCHPQKGHERKQVRVRRVVQQHNLQMHSIHIYTLSQ